MKASRIKAAMAMMFGMLLPAGLAAPADQAQRRAVRVRSTTVAGRGPGWTQAHVKRMARKRRNQQRHRAHCKRGRS